MVREFGSEFDMRSNAPYLLQRETGDFDGMELFRSGRDALRAVALRSGYDRVVLPALCCQSVADPFIRSGLQPVFYTLNDRLEPDLEQLETLLSRPSIFLNLNYFGKPFLSGEAVRSLRQTHPENLYLLDDTQGLLTDPQERNLYDAVAVSVRKWFALPDGGVLWQRTGSGETMPAQPEFARLRREAMERKSRYLESGDPAEKERFRALLGQAVHLIDTDDTLAGMEPESVSLLRHMDFQAILRRREANCAVLKSLLSLCGNLEFLPDRPRGGGLYFPILVKERDAVQKALAEKDIYCPVIWPLPAECGGGGPVEQKIASSMLALPCDQRYGADDMTMIAETVCGIVERVGL